MKHLITILLWVLCSNLLAQDSIHTKKIAYYGIELGYGVGTGFPLQKTALGLSFKLELMAQKQNSTIGLGFRAVQEFLILGTSNISNAIFSFDGMYGRSYKKNFFNGSINAGLGYVTAHQKGKLISTDGMFFGDRVYEKIISKTIGFPVALKASWLLLPWVAVSGEVYLNINSINSFYGVQLGSTFGVLGPKSLFVKNKKLKKLL